MLTIQQWIIFGILIISLILFLINRWRYDVVALLTLLSVTLFGLIPAERAFSGFSNPAVITVAAVFVVSRSLQNSGFVDILGNRLLRLKGGINVQLAALTGIVAFLSSFMNNIGSLALMLPVALQIARKKKISSSIFLMPIAFASLLGGMTTLIGTPPNIIVASFRAEIGASPFRMFDFTPVGVSVALIGLIFIAFIGWRLVPKRLGQMAADELFDVEHYFTEVRVSADSKLVGEPLYKINSFVDGGVNVLGVVREGERQLVPSPKTKFAAGDILILLVDTEKLEVLVNRARLELVGSERIMRVNAESDEVVLIEAIVTANSILVGETAFNLDLRRQHGVNLLAVGRQSSRFYTRLDRVVLRAGDVLLLQCYARTVKDVLAQLGCLPLAKRDLRLGYSPRIFPPLAIFCAALLFSALDFVPVQIAFVIAAVILVIFRFVSLNEAYNSIDWPVIIMLGAMIPVGEALQTTGGAQLIANSLLYFGMHLPASLILTILLIITMLLSNLINNSATMVLMAPIGIGVAQGLGVSVDTFLMTIAIGSSCAFLTPIGHQSNTLVMGPGGYRFSDYWRMGLPLSILIIVISIPLILWFWPL